MTRKATPITPTRAPRTVVTRRVSPLHRREAARAPDTRVSTDLGQGRASSKNQSTGRLARTKAKVGNARCDSRSPSRCQNPRAAASADDRHAPLARVAQTAVVNGLFDLSSSGDASPEVQAVVDDALDGLHDRLSGTPSGTGARAAHAAWLAREVARHLDRPGGERPMDMTSPGPPPGSPIGAPALWSACTQDDGMGGGR